MEKNFKCGCALIDFQGMCYAISEYVPNATLSHNQRHTICFILTRLVCQTNISTCVNLFICSKSPSEFASALMFPKKHLDFGHSI